MSHSYMSTGSCKSFHFMWFLHRPQIQRPLPAKSVSRQNSNAQTSQSRDHGNSTRWARGGNGEMLQASNRSFPDHERAAQVEFTAPIVQHRRPQLVLPPAASSRHPHAPQASNVEEEHQYEGCDGMFDSSAKRLA